MSETQESTPAPPPYLSPWVGDGFDRKATIAAEPGLWSATRIRYRLAPALEIASAFQQAEQDPTNSVKYHAALLATRITGWDIKTQGGGKVGVTAENIASLQFLFYQQLRQIVYGEATAVDGDQEHATRDDDSKN